MRGLEGTVHSPMDTGPGAGVVGGETASKDDTGRYRGPFRWPNKRWLLKLRFYLLFDLVGGGKNTQR